MMLVTNEMMTIRLVNREYGNDDDEDDKFWEKCNLGSNQKPWLAVKLIVFSHTDIKQQQDVSNNCARAIFFI